MKLADVMLACGTRLVDHEGPLWCVRGYAITQCYEWSPVSVLGSDWAIKGEHQIPMEARCWYAIRSLAYEKAANAMEAAGVALRAKASEVQP